MSFLNKHFVEVRCDLASSCGCAVSFAAETEERAEAGALECGWVKRGWKHCCAECVRRAAIDKQRKT